MPRTSSWIAILTFATFAAGCSSRSDGVVSLEARGAGATISGGSEVVGGGDHPAFTKNGGPIGVSGTGNGYSYGGNFDAALRSYGLRAALNTPIVDVIGGVDEHRLDGQDVPEMNLGLRKRLADFKETTLYVEALMRRGRDFDTLSGPRNYDGIEAGVGFIIRVADHAFLDFGLGYETTLGHLDLEHGDTRVQDVVLSFGLGFWL